MRINAFQLKGTCFRIQTQSITVQSQGLRHCRRRKQSLRSRMSRVAISLDHVPSTYGVSWTGDKWGIRTAILVGIMIYQWIHGHPFSDKLIYRHDTCSWTSISHVSRTIHIQVLMVESGRVAQLPMLKFCRDFVAGEEKQKGQEREAFSRQLFQSSLCAFSWLRTTVMFLYIFDFEEHKSQPMSTHQSPFFIVFFPHHSMKLAKNSSLAELASSFAELETWRRTSHWGSWPKKLWLSIVKWSNSCGLRRGWECLENGMVNDHHPVYGDMYN